MAPTGISSAQFQPGSIGWTKALVLNLTGSPIHTLTAPGGGGRKSVRALLEDGRSVIVTRRETPARSETEAALLQVLSSEGAPVPAVIGFRDGLLVQQDVGRRRLSFAMASADADQKAALARSALTSLQACRAAMDRRPDILSKLPGLGTRPGWAEDFVSQPFFLSGDLGIAMPDVDANALAMSLAHDPLVFTRWDARLANAAVQPDGSVTWFDWDLFGRRAGVEDLGWAIADEYWRLNPSTTTALLSEVMPDADARGLALRMAVLVAANRLKRITARIDANGWADADDALRLDRIGAVPEVVRDLCARMPQIAASDPLTAGFEDWFKAVGKALIARAPD